MLIWMWIKKHWDARFSVAHSITSASARDAALVIMVVATVTARLMVLQLCARKLPRSPSPRRPPARCRARRTIGL